MKKKREFAESSKVKPGSAEKGDSHTRFDQNKTVIIRPIFNLLLFSDTVQRLKVQSLSHYWPETINMKKNRGGKGQFHHEIEIRSITP